MLRRPADGPIPALDMSFGSVSAFQTIWAERLTAVRIVMRTGCLAASSEISFKRHGNRLKTVEHLNMLRLQLHVHGELGDAATHIGHRVVFCRGYLCACFFTGPVFHTAADHSQMPDGNVAWIDVGNFENIPS